MNKILSHCKFRYPKGSKEYSLYTRWYNMMAKCYHKNNARYSKFGAIGIEVCDEWKDFKNFFEYFKDYDVQYLLIKRIDTKKNFCPENCVVADKKNVPLIFEEKIYINYKGKK